MARAKKQQPVEVVKKMGFISEPLDDVKEAEAAAEGDYDLRILKAVDGKSKKGTKMATITIAFTDPDAGDAPPFQHYLRDPGDIEDEDQKRMAALEAKRFQAVFDLADDWECEDIAGEEGNCHVIQEVGDDNVTRNRLRLPRLKD